MTTQAQVLVTIPHPDDAESRMAGTVARWTREGKDVVYVVCTNGDKGTNDPNIKPQELAQGPRAGTAGCCKASPGERSSILALSRPGSRRYIRVQKRDCAINADDAQHKYAYLSFEKAVFCIVALLNTYAVLLVSRFWG